MRAFNKSHKDQGFALVVVLLVLLLVTTLCAEMIFSVRTGLQEGRHAKQNAQSRGLAKSGINLALFHLVDMPMELTEDGPYILGTTRSTNLGAGRINFQLISESSKIDLNTINRPLLSQFLEEQGYDPEEQEILMDSMQDWRDNDDLHRLNGAEDDFYGELEPPYKAKNGPFTDPAEIFMVRGAEKLARKINPADCFTVYNPGGKINFNTLSPTMLKTMAAGDEERISDYYELKEDGIDLGAEQAQLILDDQYTIWQPYLTYTKGKNHYYTAIASGFAGGRTNDESTVTDAPLKKQLGCRMRLLFLQTGTTFRYLRWSEENIVE